MTEKIKMYLHEYHYDINGNKRDNGYWEIVENKNDDYPYIDEKDFPVLVNKRGGWHNYVPSLEDEILNEKQYLENISHSSTNADNGYWIDVWIAYHSTAIYLFLFLKFGYDADLTREEIEDYANSFLMIDRFHVTDVISDYWNSYQNDICLLPSKRFENGFIFIECQRLILSREFKTNIPSTNLAELHFKLKSY